MRCRVAGAPLSPGGRNGCRDFSLTFHAREGALEEARQWVSAILAIGVVPLPVLEQRMARFIAAEKAAKPSAQ